MIRTARPASALLRHIAAVIALAAILLGAPPAQAHDVLEATSLANGSTVQAVPASVVLTFDHIPIGVGTEILVKDPTGTNQADGEAATVDTNVTRKLKPGAPAGTYTVIWRVVSADSHPIEGTFTFTAKGPGNTASSASGPATQTAGTTAAAPATPPAGSGGGPVLWLIIAAALIALAVGAFFVRRALTDARDE